MFSTSSASILEMKLVLATISVSTPASGPKPTTLTKKIAHTLSWQVRDRTMMKRPAR